MCSSARIAAAFLPSMGPAAGTVWQGEKYSQICVKQSDSGWLDYAILLISRLYYPSQSVSELSKMVEQLTLIFSSSLPPFQKLCI